MDDINVKRNRYYGIRVGDLVEYGVPGIPETHHGYRVVGYGFMDNNYVILKDKNGKEVEAVAEWRDILHKVEDD